MITTKYYGPVQHRIDWSLTHELLMELSGGLPYTLSWAARVIGCDERNVLRFKKDGTPDRYVENLVERANRGVTYTPDRPPERAEISKRHSKRYFKVERVPFEVVLPYIVERLGEDFTPQQAVDLFGVKKNTFYDWRKAHPRGSHKPGVPAWRVVQALGVTRVQLGLPEEDPRDH